MLRQFVVAFGFISVCYHVSQSLSFTVFHLSYHFVVNVVQAIREFHVST
jgi:hypothetical protein